jgi:ribosomal protein S27AE
MSRYYETPDVDRERESPLQGVCKDCGNGTLNNELNPAFELFAFDAEGEDEKLYCKRCGSTHVDVVRF